MIVFWVRALTNGGTILARAYNLVSIILLLIPILLLLLILLIPVLLLPPYTIDFYCTTPQHHTSLLIVSRLPSKPKVRGHLATQISITVIHTEIVWNKYLQFTCPVQREYWEDIVLSMSQGVVCAKKFDIIHICIIKINFSYGIVKYKGICYYDQPFSVVCYLWYSVWNDEYEIFVQLCWFYLEYTCTESFACIKNLSIKFYCSYKKHIFLALCLSLICSLQFVNKHSFPGHNWGTLFQLQPSATQGKNLWNSWITLFWHAIILQKHSKKIKWQFISLNIELHFRVIVNSVFSYYIFELDDEILNKFRLLVKYNRHHIFLLSDNKRVNEIEHIRRMPQEIFPW